MYIKEFHIEEFGPLSEIQVENLPRSMAVFLGDNEAGKSSSMEFIRTMLTGIPNKRDNFCQSMKKFKGGQIIIDDEEYGEMLVARVLSARSNRSLRVYNGDGKKIDNSLFHEVTDNISQEVYRLVFGFNLAELQNFSAFQENAVLENILGASYGLGLVSPSLAMQKIQEQMDRLYKAKHKNTVLQGLVNKWKDDRALFEKSYQRIEKFDDLQSKLQSASLSYEELKDEKIHIKEQEEELYRLLALWGQWKKWADLQKEFVKLRAFSEDFLNEDFLANGKNGNNHADNAEIIFTRILEEYRIKQEYSANLFGRQREFEARLRKFNLKMGLISQYLPIRELAPHALEANKILTEIPRQKVQIEQSFYGINKQNEKFLDKWHTFNPLFKAKEFANAERTLEYFAKALQDSSFVENLEVFAVKMREAKAQVQNAQTALEYAKRDVEKAEHKYQAVLKEKSALFADGLPVDVLTADVLPDDRLAFVGQDSMQIHTDSPTEQYSEQVSKQSFDRELQTLQDWQNRLQEGQDRENESVGKSTSLCAEFLNKAKELGIPFLRDLAISPENAKDFSKEYMQIANIVREMEKGREALLAKARTLVDLENEYIENTDRYKNTEKQLAEKQALLAENAEEFLEREQEILTEQEKNKNNPNTNSEINSERNRKLTEQDKARLEKIHAIEKTAGKIIGQLENALQNSEQAEREALPLWAKIPSVLCIVSGLVLLLLRLGGTPALGSSSQLETLFGTLNIPFFLPIVLLTAGLGQGLFLWFYAKNEPKENNISEKISAMVQDLQELQDIQEKLLQTFYPEQIMHTAGEGLEKEDGQEKTENSDKTELLQFTRTLEETIAEPRMSHLAQVIAKAKERAGLYSHYARKFYTDMQENSHDAGTADAEILSAEIPYNGKGQKSLQDLTEERNALQNDEQALAELLAGLEAEQGDLQRKIHSFGEDFAVDFVTIQGNEPLFVNVPALSEFPAFMQEIGLLDNYVGQINALSKAVQDCHALYDEFVLYARDNVPALYERIVRKGVLDKDFISVLTGFRQGLKEEQFRKIQEKHGAVFAESLASVEESKEHFADVEKTLAERRNILETLYEKLADFLREYGFLGAGEQNGQNGKAQDERMQNDFVNQFKVEETEDILSGVFFKIKQCVEALYHLHGLHKEQEDRKNALQAMHDGLKNFIEPLRALLLRAEFSPRETIRQDSDYIQVYQDLLDEAEQEHALFRQKENLLKEYEQAKENYRQAHEDVLEVERNLQELYQASGVASEEEMRGLLGKLKQSERLVQQAMIIEEGMREEAVPNHIARSENPQGREYKENQGQKPLPEIFAFFDDNAKNRFEYELQELQEESAGLERIEKHIQLLQSKVEAEQSVMYEESLSNMAGYRMKKTEEDIRHHYNKWLEHAFAREVLERAKKQYEEKSQPHIVQIASLFFQKITDNAWNTIKVNLEDRSVNVLNENGTLLNAEMLSQGAREQLYLSLRLAHIKHRSLTKRPLPILMDDIMVNFDERRVRNTAEVLSLMVETGQDSPTGLTDSQQIFFYTCHEKTARILEEIVQGTKIYRVENKKIFAV